MQIIQRFSFPLFQFLDSRIMENIRILFNRCLENLTEFYFKVGIFDLITKWFVKRNQNNNNNWLLIFKVINFLILRNGNDDILSILHGSIQCYRIWYGSVLEKLPGDYKPPGKYGFYATTRVMSDINLSYKRINRSLLYLNEMVCKLKFQCIKNRIFFWMNCFFFKYRWKIFDVAWMKKLVMGYRCLDDSLVATINSLDGFIFNNRIGRHEVDRIPTEMTINGIQQLDPVTNSIKSVFPEVYIALFKWEFCIFVYLNDMNSGTVFKPNEWWILIRIIIAFYII